MADITLSYKGSTIATMRAPGSKTIQTQGKYCEADIEIKYNNIYPDLPSDYQELEYLVTTPANGYPRIIADGFGVQAGDHVKFTFSGHGVICGQRTNGWNFNVDTVDRFNVTLYDTAKVFYSWENLEQSLGETAYVCETSFSSTYANNMTYGGWGTATGNWDYDFKGNLGVFMVLRPTIVGDDLQTISQKYVCVRVLIPCYRKADGVNGFYDSVNNVFYTAVFGSFTRGPEKQ